MAPKSSAANGSSSKPKGNKTPTNGYTTPKTDVEDGSKPATPLGTSRPDKAAYDTEQEKLKKEIEALQTKLVRLALQHRDLQRPNSTQ
jgi:hypothetical protein